VSSTNVDDLQSVVRGGPARGGYGDRVFRGLATGAGVVILATLAGVALFLVVRAWPAITASSEDLPGGENLLAYIWPLAFGTLVAATIAIIIAVPLSVAVALFISHIAPRKIAEPMSYLIDLLAAIPSVIYGLWGIAVLGPASVGFLNWLENNAGWIPFFEGPASEQTPRRLQEGALALGATRWEMIRLTVLPFGKSAIISASMLGLGRALGETMAVAIVLSVSGAVTFNLIGSGNPSTIAANIALDFPESSGLAVNALIASGLVLFAVTLVVNMAARAVINRQMRI
jgi:phosphate transport system permease protein